MPGRRVIAKEAALAASAAGLQDRRQDGPGGTRRSIPIRGRWGRRQRAAAAYISRWSLGRELAAVTIQRNLPSASPNGSHLMSVSVY